MVGGGPGGLNVAWVAAKRGHDVHVYEKRSELGGQLVPGSTPGHKAELRSLIRFQKKQAELFGVKCHLNHEVRAEDIEAFKPDVVVLATGSLPALPQVEGIDKNIVLTYEDVLNGGPPRYSEMSLSSVAGPQGWSWRFILPSMAVKRRVIEMLPKIGNGLEAMTKKIILKKLKEHQCPHFDRNQVVKNRRHRGHGRRQRATGSILSRRKKLSSPSAPGRTPDSMTR